MSLTPVFFVAAALALAPAAVAFAPVAPPAPVAPEADSVRFPEANTVVLEHDESVEVNAEGGFVRRVAQRTKALTEEGRRDLLTRSIAFNRAYGGARVLALAVVKPDGRRVALDAAAQSAEQQDPSSASANIYDPNDRLLTVSIPGVEIGDTVEFSYEESQPKPRMKGCFCDIVALESSSPVLRTRYRVSTPRSLPLVRTLIKGGDARGVAHTRDESGETLRYEWRVDDIPQLLPEPGMPRADLCARRLLISTVPDWQTVSRWYAELCEPHLKLTPEIRAKVALLTAGAKSREERLLRLYRFVSQEIRYMGVTTETEAPGYEPHDVGMTFSKRYGVCRDKAALLAAMLRAAGEQAHPVIILAGGDRIDAEVPTTYFNHAITAVREPDGEFRLMDATDESSKDPFPAYLANCSYLVAHPDGETLHVSPVPDASAHLLEGETRVRVRKDGSAAGESRLNFNGLNDTVYRAAFAQSRPEDIRRHVQQRLSGLLPGVRVTAVEISPERVQDTTRPLSMTVRFEAAEYFTRRDGKAFVRAPFVAGLFGFAGEQLARATTLERRRFPLKLAAIAGVRERLTVELPEDFGETLSMPDAVNRVNTAFSYVRTLRREGAKLTGESDLRLRALDIPVEDYAGVRADLERLEALSRKVALFDAPEFSSPESLVLARRVVCDIRDAGALTVHATERRRILNYAGMKANSELKLTWNACDPEPVVERAVVRDAAGREYAAGPAEINVLDAPWVAAAPRYTPTRTKVVALPKVEVGSEIELAYSVTRSGLPSLSWLNTFADTDPVESSEFEVTSPAALPLYWQNRADATAEVTDGRLHVRARRAITPAPSESGAPESSVWAPSVLVATVRDDAELAARVRPILEARCTPDDAVRAKAAALLAGAPAGETARLRVLRDFVAKSIRTAGPAWGEIAPEGFSGAARTLADGYGAPTDRMLLFCALARAAGFAAEPALYATDTAAVARQRYGEPLPPGFYDCVGVRVRLREAVAEYAYLDEYAHPLVAAPQGARVLDLVTGNTAVVTPPPGLGDAVSSRCRILLSETGDADVAYEEVYSGASASGFTRRIGMMRPEDRRRFEFGVVQALARDARAAGAPAVRTGHPAMVSCEARIPGLMVTQGRYAYLDLPQAPGAQFAGASDFTRKLPYAAQGPSRSRSVWEVVLPKGWKVATAPEAFDWKGPAGCGEVSVRSAVKAGASGERRLSVSFESALRPADISPAAVPALVELNRRLTKGDSWRVLLERE